MNIHTIIYLASHDKTNFFALGDCTTTLTENGMEVMITLFQYLEDLITKCVEENATNIELYRAVVVNLSKDIGKRYFILPSITRSCPLVLATFEVDYVEG